MYVFALISGSNAERAGVPVAHLVDIYAINQRNINCLKNLLQSCHTHHLTCCLDLSTELVKMHEEQFRSPGTPRRLVDVRMNDDTKIRVMEVSGCPKYATLSYCWGSYPQLCATRENLSQLEQGLSISSLCPAIQDAISITRHLDIPYLWVDALCITQGKDKEADWESELQTMGLIYAQSYVTISAAANDDCGKSFTTQRRESTFIAAPSCSYPPSNGTDVLLFRLPLFDFAEEFERDVNKSALSNRAWVMQERMLSPRTIHITSTQIYWECRSFFWAENGNACASLGYDGYQPASLFMNSLLHLGAAMLKHEEPRVQDNAVSIFLRSWCDIVAQYSTLQLTYPRDKLSAIAGLARLASLLMPGPYISGIWGCDLANGLLWTPFEHPMQVPVQKSAASWSWASTVSPVELCCRQISARDNSLIVLKEVNRDENGLEILVIEGRLYECVVSESPQPYHKPRRAKHDTGQDPTIPLYKFWLPPNYDADCEQDLCRYDCIRGSRAKLFFLPLIGSRHCRGLLLEEDVSEQRTYRRRGIGWYSSLPHDMAHNELLRLV